MTLYWLRPQAQSQLRRAVSALEVKNARLAAAEAAAKAAAGGGRELELLRMHHAIEVKGLTARVAELEAELAYTHAKDEHWPRGEVGVSQGRGAQAAREDRDACLAEAIARLAKTHVAKSDKRDTA